MAFLDTGFFVAFKNQRDRYHEHAQHIAAEIFNGRIIKPYTCDYVLDEAVNVVRMRLKDNPSKAFELACFVGKSIFSDKYWNMAVIRKELIKDCLDIYCAHPEINMPFTDLVVGRMAVAYGQKKIVTCDANHFKHIQKLFTLDEPIYLMNNDDFKKLKEKVIRGTAKPHELVFGEGAPPPST